MSAGAVTLESTATDGSSSFVSWSVAIVLALILVAAGLEASLLPIVISGAAAFLFLAVASDVRSRRVPNVLTFPALLAALLVSPWFGATSGPVEALAGTALGFALLVVPYAIGGMGAGDVKAMMALGAWLGPATILGATVWAVITGGCLGLVLLATRGELAEFARRWGRTLMTLFSERRLAYEAPPAGSGAASGIPFAVAIALGLSVQWVGGFPW